MHLSQRSAMILLLSTFVLFVLQSRKSFAGPAELFPLINSKKLYDDLRWRKLLFYTPKLFVSERSIFDTPDVFLDADGKWDAKKEMLALAKAIYLPVEQFPDPEKHALCRFPARSKFLIKELGIDAESLPKPACELVRKWKERHKIDRVSLVFSSYFTDNPASLFGHTFLQLHRGKDAMGGSKLLDLAVNYAAHPPDDIGFDYYIQGLLGRFPGKYDVLPFYVKIQEYNNYEQRDLWHYELNFSPEDLERLIDLLWELEHAAAGYFYFDDNCSLVILMTIDAAKPDLTLYEHLKHPWIIPVDTLKAITKVQGLVKNVDYTPSTRTKFLERYHLLSDDERKLLQEILDANDLERFKTQLASLSPETRAKVLDALVELLDFKDDVAGAAMGKTYKNLRLAVLAERSQIAVKPIPIMPRNDSEAPHLGHESTRFGLGYEGGVEHSLALEWRPAFHDLLDNAKGFPVGLQIEFMNTRLQYRFDQNDLLLKDFTLIKIFSLPTIDRIIRSPAWTLSLGGKQETACGNKSEQTCLVHYAEGGIGDTLVLLSERLVLYSLARAKTLLIHDGFDRYGAEAGVELGAVAKIGQTTALRTYILPSKRFTAERQRIFHESKLELSQEVTTRFNVRASVTYADEQKLSLGVMTHFYY